MIAPASSSENVVISAATVTEDAVIESEIQLTLVPRYAARAARYAYELKSSIEPEIVTAHVTIWVTVAPGGANGVGGKSGGTEGGTIGGCGECGGGAGGG